MPDSGYPAYIPQLPADLLHAKAGTATLHFAASDHATAIVAHGLGRDAVGAIAGQDVAFIGSEALVIAASPYVLDFSQLQIIGYLIHGGAFTGDITVSWLAF